ncbi:retrovirus-related Pol polyprotein LINE-1 [Elysia marginata]|uniref:Retrovirus-related Pol polyprotein LINE-1 n=1 Tax=Elysia marginata TaxID=1093978 RepID=A0AAV4EY27_9GAST|nr:retrovirus-related Pol polyprotein LINE-1 [Elysia marginata]
MRPVILYGAECWSTGVKEENILEKTEMRMLRRIKGVTLKDKIKSEDIREELGVGSIKTGFLQPPSYQIPGCFQEFPCPNVKIPGQARQNQIKFRLNETFS